MGYRVDGRRDLWPTLLHRSRRAAVICRDCTYSELTCLCRSFDDLVDADATNYSRTIVVVVGVMVIV